MTILYIIVMEQTLREKQIREILDEDLLINKRVSELLRKKILIYSDVNHFHIHFSWKLISDFFRIQIYANDY